MKKTILILASSIFFVGCTTDDFVPKYLAGENDQYKVMYGKGTIHYQEQFPEEGKRAYSVGYTDGCKLSKIAKPIPDIIYNSNYYYRLGFDDGVLTCRGGKNARNYSN